MAKHRKLTMRELLHLTKALADETRVRALLALRDGEVCVCQITELLGLAPSTVSKHLSILARAGLVASRKQGRWIHYRLPGRSAPPAVRGAMRWVETALDGDARAAEDRRALKRVLKQDPAELCKRQCCR